MSIEASEEKGAPHPFPLGEASALEGRTDITD